MNTMMLLTIGGEGHDRKNRFRQPEIAQTGVQAGMSYYINNTMSISPDPLASLRYEANGIGEISCRQDREWARWFAANHS